MPSICTKNLSNLLKSNGSSMTCSSVRKAFDKTVEKAGIEDFRLHDCRHTFATKLVQKGCDLYRVKELLGHKTISMTMRYAHHYPESLRSSVELLDKCDKSVTINAVNFGEIQKTF